MIKFGVENIQLLTTLNSNTKQHFAGLDIEIVMDIVIFGPDIAMTLCSH